MSSKTNSSVQNRATLTGDATKIGTHGASPGFPILRRPRAHPACPVIVSIPHYGTEPIPDANDEDFVKPDYRRFPQGYADAFAAALYGDLHDFGATVLASPYSRLYVDLNRARSHYDVQDGVVTSVKGVARTHLVGERPIFASALSHDELERRLVRYYDPYHAALDLVVSETVAEFGAAVVLDAHTGSEKGMGEHEVIVGTRRGETASRGLADTVAAVFQDHGLRTNHDVPGYSGAHTVQRLGRDGPACVQAVQLEVNSRLLMRGSRREYFQRIDAGLPPAPDVPTFVRIKGCLAKLVARVATIVTDSADALSRVR